MKVPADQLSPGRPHPPHQFQRPQIHSAKSPRGIRALPYSLRPLRNPLDGRQEALQRLHRSPHHLLHNLDQGPQCAARRQDSEFQARKRIKEEAGGMFIVLESYLGIALTCRSSWRKIQRTCKMTMMRSASYSWLILPSARTTLFNHSNL